MKTARSRYARIPTLLLAVTAAIALVACGRSAPEPAPAAAPAHDHDHGHGHHHHHHEAPRGGTLVELGDHVAHIEFLLEAETGHFRAYVLDGHAENPVHLSEAALRVEITLEGSEDSFPLNLDAQLNPLTGERPGATSEYAGRSVQLVGAERFEVRLPALTVRGVEIDAMVFPFPEGNE